MSTFSKEDIIVDLINLAQKWENEWWEKTGKKRYEEYVSNPSSRSKYYFPPRSAPQHYENLSDALHGTADWLEKCDETLPSGRHYKGEAVIGGENCGPIYEIVFWVDDRLFKVDGSYDSQDGISWWCAGIEEVQKKQKVIDVYESI